MSDSFWSHGLQHARLPWPSPSPGACSNSCPLSWWWHPIISSSVVPFSSHLQSFPASGSFPMSQFFTSGGQSIELSASAWVLPMNIQDWFPLGWTGWILAVQGTLKSLLQHHCSKASILQRSAFFILGYWGPPWVSEAVPLARIMARWRLCTHQATAAFEGKQDKEERKLCLSICRPCITFPSWVLESQWEEWVYVWEEELMN